MTRDELLQRARQYVVLEKNETFRAEIETLLKNEAWDELNDRFYRDLVSRGIPRDEIERVYQSLREKGYGEAEARRRSQIALERLRAERDLAVRRRARLHPPADTGPTQRRGGPAPPAGPGRAEEEV